MVADLTHFKVLMTAGKGLTPAQQAWDPRTLELYAQLGIKRAAVTCLGQIRAILWTDHANVKRLQTADDIDVKHLRWVSEIRKWCRKYLRRLKNSNKQEGQAGCDTGYLR